MYRTEIQMVRDGKKIWQPPCTCRTQTGIVIRIRGISGVSPKFCKMLQHLHHRQIFNGTFVNLNKASINMLRILEPYIEWGNPNLKSVN